MTYRTTLNEADFDAAVRSLGFVFLEQSCFTTTYTRGNDMLGVADNDETFEDREIATDFRFSDAELVTLKATKL